MRLVNIKNSKLLKALNRYSEFVMTHFYNVEDHVFERGARGKKWQEVCSDEYLYERMGLDPLETGFPRHSLGYMADDASTSRGTFIPHISKENEILDNSIMEAIGVQFCALKAIYPKDGYIDWHNNCNCPGQNLIMSYSAGGDGWFKYYDLKKKEIVTMPDKPGWTAKVGYYGSDTEPDKIVWHCAKTAEPRITVSYVIRSGDMWEEMVYDIEHDDDDDD